MSLNTSCGVEKARFRSRTTPATRRYARGNALRLRQHPCHLKLVAQRTWCRALPHFHGSATNDPTTIIYKGLVIPGSSTTTAFRRCGGITTRDTSLPRCSSPCKVVFLSAWILNLRFGQASTGQAGKSSSRSPWLSLCSSMCCSAIRASSAISLHPGSSQTSPPRLEGPHHTGNRDDW